MCGDASMSDKLRKSIEESPVVDINGYQYFINPLSDGIPSIDPDVLSEAADKLISMCDFDCDCIVTAETMGIPVTTAVSLKLGKPYTVVRKRRYGLPGEVDISQTTGYSKNSMYINGLKKGDRVVIIDDVLSTGGTMRAIIDALKNVIGCVIVDAAVLFCKSDEDERIFRETGVRVKKLIDARIVDGKVSVNN